MEERNIWRPNIAYSATQPLNSRLILRMRGGGGHITYPNNCYVRIVFDTVIISFPNVSKFFIMPSCAAYGCTNRPDRKEPGISFHKFPKNEVQRLKWITALGRLDWTPTNLSVLCTAHFSEDQVDRTSLSSTRLRENAVPNIFPAYPLYLENRERTAMSGTSQHSDGSEEQFQQVSIKQERAAMSGTTQQGDGSEVQFQKVFIKQENLWEDELVSPTDDLDSGQNDAVPQCSKEIKVEDKIQIKSEDIESELEQTKPDMVSASDIDGCLENSEMCSSPKSEESTSTLPNSSSDVDQAFICDVCGMSYTRIDDLKTHQKTHSDERPFSCESCTKSFTQYRHLRVHQKLHESQRPFPCEVCGKSFTHQCTLKTHQRSHLFEHLLKCDTCGKSFSRYCHLERHQKRHTGERRYTCDACGKSFIDHSNLITHRRLHTGERPYVCDVCGKAFNQSSGLKAHQRTHTGEDMYKCDICGKKFQEHSSFNHHHKVHERDVVEVDRRRYSCEVCGKSFADPSNLKRHRRIHTSERPYVCDICGRAFNQSSVLKSHKRTHTNERPYVCICGKSFNHLSNLKTHQRIHKDEGSSR